MCANIQLTVRSVSDYIIRQVDVVRPGQEVAQSLVVASKSARWELSSRERFLELAARLTRDDRECLRLKAEIIHRQSILMRLRGDTKGSERAIEAFLSNLPADELASENFAALHLSQATNRAYDFRFSEAHVELKKWISSFEHQERQQTLIWDQIFCVGRLMRGEGRFEEARACFESCLETPELRDSKRFLIKFAVADLYCELAYIHPNTPYLSQTASILEPEINGLTQASGQHLKGFRRLLLSLTEVKIRQGHSSEADLLSRQLLAIYNNLREPDIVDRLGHVRTLIALARISPTLEDAAERWKDVLVWNELYNPLEEEVFTCAVAYLFLCLTWYKLGNLDTSLVFFRMRVLERQRRQYLIPGIGTYLLHEVCEELQSTSQWRVDIRP